MTTMNRTPGGLMISTHYLSDEELIFKEIMQNRTMALLIPIFVLTGLCCVGCNVLIWRFYFNKRDNIMHYLYLLLATSDITSGVSAVLHALVWLSFVMGRKNVGDYCTMLAFFITGVSARVSAWLQLLLSLTRTIIILFPTSRLVLKSAVTTLSLLVLMSWSCLALFDLYSTIPLRQEYSYLVFYQYLLFLPAVGQGLYDHLFVTGVYMELTPSHYLITWIMVPFAVPVLLVVCCSFVQIIELLRRQRIRNSVTINSSRINQRITGTVLRLTFIFALFNTPFFILFAIYYWHYVITNTSILVPYICGTMLPILNSCTNPIVLICRGQGLRRYTKTVCSKVSGMTWWTKDPAVIELTRMADGCSRSRNNSSLTVSQN